MTTPNFAHLPEQHLFRLHIGTSAAEIEYRRTENGIRLLHTFVPPELRGQGAAAQLVKQVLEYARAQGWKVEPECEYVQAYLAKHPEYADLHA